MNKTDKQKIAESFKWFQAGAAQCANTCYNLAKSDQIPAHLRSTMSEAVRAHDAARNHFVSTLRRFGILLDPPVGNSQDPASVSPPSQTRMK